MIIKFDPQQMRTHQRTRWYAYEVRTKSGWKRSKNYSGCVEPDWNESVHDALDEMRGFAREQRIALRNIRLVPTEGPDCLVDGTRTLYEYDEWGNIVLPAGSRVVIKPATLDDLKRVVVDAASRLTVPVVVEILKKTAGVQKAGLVPADKIEDVINAINTMVSIKQQEEKTG
jgi:hypothetical protein